MIDRKLLRDLARLRGQVVTIGLVVAAGVAAYVTLQGTWTSLESSRTTYYERQRFADVFAHLKRAPLRVVADLRAIDGVSEVDPRIVDTVMVPIETLREPAFGQLVSLPDHGTPRLNQLHLTAGSLPEPGRPDDALVLESFVRAHGLEVGDTVPAVINGTIRQLRITGVAMSPEHVFPMPVAGIFSDERRFAVLWMRESIVAPAFDLNNAFNDVSIRLQPGASLEAAIVAVDRVLEPYGGVGAYGQKDQPSNNIVEGELAGLKAMATVAPMIFLGVAAFLLNVVLSRLVLLQRSQIATLKAVGYRNRAIGLHYVKLVCLIALGGSALGIVLGAYLGSAMTQMYTAYFRFPVLAYELDPRVVSIAVGVSLAAGVVGAITSATRVARLAPAEAMRPAAPPAYGSTLLDRIGLYRFIAPAARMVVREIERQPMRTMLSVIGISFAVAIMVVARVSADAMDLLLDLQFQQAWREDVTVTFLEPVSERAVRELAHLPGVRYAESMRSVPVRFTNGNRKRESAVLGYPRDGQLRRVIDVDRKVVPIPETGVMLTAKLAEVLHLQVDDYVRVEMLEGDRRKFSLRVASLVAEPFGLQGHMDLRELQRAVGEQGTTSMALLRVDPREYILTEPRMKGFPNLGGVLRKQTIIDQFKAQTADMMVVMSLILTLFAATIAIGVVYNNARNALSMRSRDLASLRVLGFRRREISAVLLGELGIQVLLSIPIGLAIGTWMSKAMMSMSDPEQYRLPVSLSATTYAYAAGVTMAAGAISALMVRRKLDRLDLIAVLKTRE
ncbi:MAG: ABC transporter permease [Polyangiales bacterium]